MKIIAFKSSKKSISLIPSINLVEWGTSYCIEIGWLVYWVSIKIK